MASSENTIQLTEHYSGSLNTSYTNDYTRGFEIYLHEKGQFWPGLEMERIGQTKSLFLPIKTEVWGTFTAVDNINLPQKSAPCETNPNYSYTSCMKDYVATTAGCHLDWVDDIHHTTGSQGPCVTMDQVSYIFKKT